jgi:ankyrin repeat domain-containing protein 50
LLQLEVHHPSKVFIVIDALDECPNSNGTRDALVAEIRKLPPIIHLLITSRHISTIEREFDKVARVEIRASDKDVRRYIESQIKGDRQLTRHIQKDPALQGTIVNTIIEKTKGM